MIFGKGNGVAKMVSAIIEKEFKFQKGPVLKSSRKTQDTGENT